MQLNEYLARYADLELEKIRNEEARGGWRFNQRQLTERADDIVRRAGRIGSLNSQITTLDKKLKATRWYQVINKVQVSSQLKQVQKDRFAAIDDLKITQGVNPEGAIDAAAKLHGQVKKIKELATGIPKKEELVSRQRVLESAFERACRREAVHGRITLPKEFRKNIGKLKPAEKAAVKKAERRFQQMADQAAQNRQRLEEEAQRKKRLEEEKRKRRKREQATRQSSRPSQAGGKKNDWLSEFLQKILFAPNKSPSSSQIVGKRVGRANNQRPQAVMMRGYDQRNQAQINHREAQPVNRALPNQAFGQTRVQASPLRNQTTGKAAAFQQRVFRENSTPQSKGNTQAKEEAVFRSPSKSPQSLYRAVNQPNKATAVYRTPSAKQGAQKGVSGSQQVFRNPQAATTGQSRSVYSSPAPARSAASPGRTVSPGSSPGKSASSSSGSSRSPGGSSSSGKSKSRGL